jgi:2-oxoglutarate dehydrogenase E2 component (dihydrolipoamide succinyltransferase)
MAVEIRVPTLGESVTEATIGRWFKQAGEAVAIDEPLVELETDKVTVEVPAPASGVLSEISVEQGATVAIGTRLGSVKEDGGEAQAAPSAGEAPAAPSKPAAEPAKAPSRKARADVGVAAMPPSPAARKLMAEASVEPERVTGSGRRGQILKEDVAAAVAQRGFEAPEERLREPEARMLVRHERATVPTRARELRVPPTKSEAAREERVKMSRLRQTIALRLKDAQNTAAMLTTFNDVDMSAIMGLRTQYKDLFERRHGIKLGLMGFFVKACIQALREIPAVNAEIDGDEIIYKNYYHIGVAVGTERGLVVPVLRDADRMSLAEIEAHIADFGRRARDGKLSIAEMQGGTFTISNGGVYGSMLSTPILNAPQSGILGMHRIEERPVVRYGQIVARPMMYVALSYDHRMVDGKEAVTFLARVKECLEDPQRFVLDL